MSLCLWRFPSLDSCPLTLNDSNLSRNPLEGEGGREYYGVSEPETESASTRGKEKYLKI